MRYLFIIFVIFFIGCSKERPTVVIYTALDRKFSEPILKKFEKDTGIRVRVKYDTESTKTVGLTTCLMEEKNHPRCDVFWNNEIVNTIRLKNAGVLAVYKSPSAKNIPSHFKDNKGYWTGFAARARILLVNTEKAKNIPSKISDLYNPIWKGKCAIARPIAGTTATHAACLFTALGEEKAKAFFEKIKANNISIESGNKTCAEKVGSGELDFCITDTDDAMIEIEEGKPVKIIYPDQDALGTLFIPNTLSLIKNCPHPKFAKKLIDYLLTPEVEIILAKSRSAQIPLNTTVKIKARVKTSREVRSMKVDFEKAALEWDKVKKYIMTSFLKK